MECFERGDGYRYATIIGRVTFAEYFERRDDCRYAPIIRNLTFETLNLLMNNFLRMGRGVLVSQMRTRIATSYLYRKIVFVSQNHTRIAESYLYRKFVLV